MIANDSSRDRITALRLVMQSWGAINIAATQYPGEKYGAWFPETFDRVLLDAPCSMQGLRATESHGIRAISQNEILSLSRRQTRSAEQRLAGGASRRPGGVCHLHAFSRGG